MAGTAATKMEDSDDSSGDSDSEAWSNLGLRVCHMRLVHATLQGMASRGAREGVKAMGRHAKTIRLGREYMGTAPVEAEVDVKLRDWWRHAKTKRPLHERTQEPSS